MYLTEVYVTNASLNVNRPFTYYSKQEIEKFCRVKVMFHKALNQAIVSDCVYTEKTPEEIGKELGYKVEEIAEVIAREARAKYNGQSLHEDRDIYKGLTVWSPNINIFRDPRWGRGHETYGEDPYLTGRLGVRFIKGLQGDGKYL